MRRIICRTGEDVSARPPVADRLLTAAELGELLGFAAGTIVDWAEKGTIPAFKLGGRLRFRESEVLDWLEAHRVGPSPIAAGGPR